MDSLKLALSESVELMQTEYYSMRLVEEAINDDSSLWEEEIKNVVLSEEDEGWHMAAERYENFLNSRKNQHILFIELGVGYNTPVIIKYPFWQMTAKNPKAVYACINRQEAVCPKEIQRQSICIEGDIGEILQNLNK